MKIVMKLKTATKTCYRFERKDADGNLMTLYLKKTEVESAGIDPNKGIVIDIEEDKQNV